MPETASIETMDKLREEEQKMRTLYRIAVAIKKGEIPASYSKKAAELATKYEGEELEEYAFGGH